MKYLNIGSGKQKLPGFINIDIEPDADVQADVREGLPFANNSVQGIYSEHFIEHLTQADGFAFFRECRRILTQDGILRIATPDLDALVDDYVADHRHPDWERFGYSWVANRCEMINLAMREWGHRWSYNEEELARVAGLAGFALAKRCVRGKSEYPIFRDCETRDGSRLIAEFVKERTDDIVDAQDTPLVSLVIPAYNSRFFHTALQSALTQTYPRMEIIVCDDSDNDKIEKAVHDASDDRIRYVNNPERLGGARNYQQCFDLSTGEYIKFLNDDDLLHPQCVEKLIRCLIRYPGVTLVTSHRQPIDQDGNALRDLTATNRPVRDDSIIEGISACGMVLQNKMNFIGEPSTTLFRKRDLENTQPTIMSFAGVHAIMNGDVAMWMSLLGKGDLVYLVETLSYFRIHPEQRQAEPEVQELGEEAWRRFREQGQHLGIWNPGEQVELRSHPLDIRVQWSDDVLPLIKQADRCLNRDDDTEAIRMLREATFLAPDDPWLVVTIGNLLLKNGDVEGARKEYVKATVLHPEYIPGYIGLGALALQQGNNQEAENALLKVVALQPTDLETSKVIGRIYLESERFEDGIKAYTFILRQAPRDVESMMALGVCQVGTGDLDYARKVFNKVLEIDPQNETARENLVLLDNATT
ncbi:glycosyltransferase [Candidatus Neomarinimicrobiota bacterium]